MWTSSFYRLAHYCYICSQINLPFNFCYWYWQNINFCGNVPAETVIYRIFYYINRSANGRLTLRELKRGDLVAAMQHVDEEDDINKVLRLLCQQILLPELLYGESYQRDPMWIRKVTTFCLQFNFSKPIFILTSVSNWVYKLNSIVVQIFDRQFDQNSFSQRMAY